MPAAGTLEANLALEVPRPGRLAATTRTLVRVAATVAAAATVAGRTLALPPRGGLHRRARLLADGSWTALRIHGVAPEVEGSVPTGPALLACNHVSWLDPLVVAAFAPCLPIAKLDVRGWPAVGALAARLGVIFHARGDAASGERVLREVEAALGQGLAVLNFPEGTTTAGDDVLPFKRGLFGLAARLGVPVVPVAIRYHPASLAWTGDATFVPHYLGLAARADSRVQLRFGAPIFTVGAAAPAPAGGRGAIEPTHAAAALAELTRRQVQGLLRGAA